MKIDAERLRGFLDCMHEEADERDKHTKQIAEIVKSAKEAGFDTKAVRKVFARERMDEGERARQDDLLETYEGALGGKGRALQAIRDGMPVGEAAAAHGVHRATLARARHGDSHVANQPSNATTPHDPSTGEVIESPTAGVEPLAEGHPASGFAGEAEHGDGAQLYRTQPRLASDSELASGPSLAAADCGASPEPAAVTPAVNADPLAGRVSPDHANGQGSEVGKPRQVSREVARVVPPALAGTPIQQSCSPELPTSADVDAAVVPIGNAGRSGEHESCGGVDGHASVVTQPRAPGLDGRAAPAVATGEGAGSQSGPHDTRTWDAIVGEIPAHLRRATA